jgi:hypothetical protein
MDDRLAMAVSHWAPRFTTNGVTAGDFDRIVNGISSWDEWCTAWSAVAAEHERLGRDALAAGRTISTGEHLSQAAVYFHFAKFLAAPDRSAVRCWRSRANATVSFRGSTRSGWSTKPAGMPRLLLLEQGNHGCANLAPFHRQVTADWAAERLAATVSRSRQFLRAK